MDFRCMRWTILKDIMEPRDRLGQVIAGDGSGHALHMTYVWHARLVELVSMGLQSEGFSSRDRAGVDDIHVG